MKNFKRIIIGTLLIGMLSLSSGCGTVNKIFGKKASAEANAKAKVENVESQIGANIQAKLTEAANLTYGVGYALSKEEKPSQAVEVAKDLNTRMASLTGAPTIDEMKKMKQMIDDLTSQLATERARGAKELASKDNDIYALQLETKLLMEAKDKEIQKYMKLAQDTAMKADATAAELQDYKGWFGLKAVVKGLWQFAKSAAWILGIGSILFLILRFAAASNPIAASIFAIFNMMGSWVVNIIKVIVPKAVEMAGHVATDVANKYRDVMTKMIDNIEALKEMQKRDPTKKYTIDELLTELSKSLNTDEKALVTKIKQDIGYNG